ncbi:hypothetical protein SAMN05892883_2049 [Jatrophihabitans sp. GAS493]|uniref:hypothetical protein n=1 Tax=Jatrophihabitans sp. GAS493 TaxID=1907575 RepID=UPI000BB71C25|nr:hypothetical protein [Jatrophihabitans sp. GAS493]SOD72697.1 hypothetical protein SAMN05892883_2049 [Jatrophihabitans sp. GAS493]
MSWEKVNGGAPRWRTVPSAPQVTLDLEELGLLPNGTVLEVDTGPFRVSVAKVASASGQRFQVHSRNLSAEALAGLPVRKRERVPVVEV